MEKELERQGGSRDTGSPQKPGGGESCCMERQLCCLTMPDSQGEWHVNRMSS